MNANNDSGLPDPQTRGDQRIRVLLMIASMEGGGSEQQTLLLLKHLDRRRFAPELYLLRRTGELLAHIPSDVPVHSFEDAAGRQDKGDRRRWPWRGERAAGMHWTAPGWLKLNWPKLNWPGKIHRAQVRDLQRLLRDRQIDVIYDRTFLMTLIAGPAAAKLRVPRVSTIVSLPSRVVPLNGGRFLAVKRRRLRTAYAAAAAVVCVSGPAARDAAQYYGLPRRRLQVIPNPVDAAALDAVVASSPPPPRDDRWTIACVGRLSVEKGQATLLAALDRLRRIYPDFPLPRVWMIGDGPLRGQLEQTSASLGLQSHVQFLGHRERPACWIAAADAVCLPSYFEGFPNVMLEAMALGVPVIARSIEVTRSLGSLAWQPQIRGRDYLALFDEGSGPGESPAGIQSSDPEEAAAVSLAKKIRRVQLNTAATQSRVQAARRLAREAHAVRQLVPRIERTLRKASGESWQMRPGR